MKLSPPVTKKARTFFGVFVQFLENIVFRGWKRLVFLREFGVVRVVELVKFLKEGGGVNE